MSTNLAGIFRNLAEKDIRLWLDGDVLRFDAPAGGLDPDLRASIVARKLELIAFLRSTAEAEHKPLPRRTAAERIPLSVGQERIWFLNKLIGPNAVYNVVSSAMLGYVISLTDYRAILAEIVSRHETLRTRFAEDADGGPYAVVEPQVSLATPLIDLSGIAGREERDAEIRRLVLEEEFRLFDLAEGPLVSASLIRLQDNVSVALLNCHHIAVDAWSMGILAEELVQLGRATFDGSRPSLRPIDYQYADFACWQEQQRSDGEFVDQLDYWQQQLQGLPPLLDLPTDFSRPERQRFNGRTEKLLLPAATAEAMQALCREKGATLFMGLLAAFDILLARYAGRHDIVVGSPMSARTHPDMHDTVGMFTNMVVLRNQIDDGRDFFALLDQVRRTTVEAQANQDVPFRLVVEKTVDERSLSHTPLYQVSFALNNAAERVVNAVMAQNDEQYCDNDGVLSTSVKDDLSLQVRIVPGHLELKLSHDTALFTSATAARMLTHYSTLLDAILAAPQAPVRKLDMLGVGEREELLARGTRRVARTRDVVDAIRVHALQRPDAVAVCCGDRQLSYAALAGGAAHLAAELVRRGISAEDRVALCMDRTELLPLAMLAVVAAGGAYVPIDPCTPVQRRAAILADSGARWMIGCGARDDAEGHAVPVINAQLHLPHGGCDIVAAPDCDGMRDRLAYVVYTSGTTGVPKGVAVSRGNLANLCDWHQCAFAVDADARASQVAGVGFDAMAWEVWPYLTAGAAVTLIDRKTTMHGAALALALRDLRASHAFVPTSVAEGLIGEMATVPSVATLLVGGEALAPVSALPAGVRLVNNYGPTETTVVATSGDVQAGPAAPSIGRPIDNGAAYVVDAWFRPVPVGVVGELCVGGAGVARGYLGRPDQTAERFVPDPFAEASGARMYRTGDMVRWRANGDLEFMGRADGQVKIRGYRIELAEIEHALSRHQGVAQAMVSVVGQGSDARLVGYITPHTVPVEGLRQALAATLPEYMVPSQLVAMEHFPLTNNGKVDRAALPVPDRSRDSAPGAPPVNERERALAAIWSELLDVPQISRDDSFFALGGHSLLAARMIDRARAQLGATPGLEELWLAPQLKDFCARFDGTAGGPPVALPPIVHDAAGRHEPFALTGIQQAYWLGRSDAFEMGNVAAHAYAELDLRGSFDPGAFENAFNTLIRRHDMLRVIVEDGQQRILEDVGRYVLPFDVLSAHTSEQRDARLNTVRDAMSHHVFRPERWPLFDVRVTRLGPELHRLYWSFDGLVMDGYSLRILVNELDALMQDPQASLPALEVNFRDYVLGLEAFQGTALYREARDYWLKRLDTLPRGPELPLAMDPSHIDKPGFTRREWIMETERWLRLKQRAVAAGLTPSAVLLTAFSEVLAHWSRSQRFSVNLTTFNRLDLHPDVPRMLGDFTSLTLLEIDRAAADTFMGRAREVQRQLWSDLKHRHFCGVEVIRELRRRSDGGVAMPVVFTSMLGFESGGADSKLSYEAELVFAVSQTSQVWIDHQVSESAKGLHTVWDAVEQLFPADLLDDMFGAYRQLVEQLADDEAGWGEAENVKLPPVQLLARERVNATEAPHAPMLLHAGCREWCERTPEAIAVIQGDMRLSYGDMAQLARHHARRLREAGVLPNQLVAVVMHKSWRQIVAVLAILEAGGAYLPIDADLPPARIAQLLVAGDVGIALVAPDFNTAQDFPTHVTPWVIDGSSRRLPAEPALEPAQSEHDLAYVIFTSGSTGAPKGVAIDHRGASNTVADINRRFSVTADDRVLALSSLSFDLSVYDIFGLLGVGGAVVLPEHGAERDPAHWRHAMSMHGVSVWNTVPALMQLLVDEHELQQRALPDSLRTVMLSGDWIPVTLPGRIRALSVGAGITSLGGATEASIWSIQYPIGEVDPQWRSIPYGTPLSNQTYHVLHADLRPCPDWVPGDLYIGGIGLATGYWKDAGKTEASFITHPGTGQRLYRTGDLGRYWPDGNIEFLGREDNQVKVQGYRIELGEIEAALARQPQVRECAVVVVGEAQRHRRLVAYYAPVADADSNASSPARHLSEALAKELPAYMVPSLFIELDALPLTSNGKVDRKALPVPKVVAGSEGGQDQAQADSRTAMLEARLLDIWKEVLGLVELSRHDLFFDVGGDSLKIVQVQIRLRSHLKLDVSLGDIYRHATVAELATLLAPRFQDAGPAEGADSGSVVERVSRWQQRRLRVAVMTDEEVAHALTLPRRGARIAERRAHEDHAHAV